MFSGIESTISFDADEPANSSVKASFPVSSQMTSDDERDKHFLTDDFIGGESEPTVMFVSTAVEVTDDNTAQITGDLTLNGVTRKTVLDTVLNQQGNHPMENELWLRFGATTTLKRSDFDLGMHVSAVSEKIVISISIEAMNEG